MGINSVFKGLSACRFTPAHVHSRHFEEEPQPETKSGLHGYTACKHVVLPTGLSWLALGYKHVKHLYLLY